MTEVTATTWEMAASVEPNAPTILLAEDHDYVRQMITVILEFAHYRVLEAGNGPEALRISDGYPGAIDLLLTDIEMPEMRGDELVDEMLLRRPGIKVLCMSGDLGVLLERCAKGSDVPFIAKPFRAEDLLARVAALIRERRSQAAA